MFAKSTPVESMVLAIQEVLGEQAHDGNTPLVPVLCHSLPSPQAGHLHCCFPPLIAALYQPSVTLFDLQHRQQPMIPFHPSFDVYFQGNVSAALPSAYGCK